MKRIKINNKAHSAYFEKARKQHFNSFDNIVEISDNNANFLLKNNYGTLIKSLPKKTGKNKPLRFGDKVMLDGVKAIFIACYQNNVESEIALINKNKRVYNSNLKRGWKI